MKTGDGDISQVGLGVPIQGHVLHIYKSHLKRLAPGQDRWSQASQICCMPRSSVFMHTSLLQRALKLLSGIEDCEVHSNGYT